MKNCDEKIFLLSCFISYLDIRKKIWFQYAVKMNLSLSTFAKFSEKLAFLTP